MLWEYVLIFTQMLVRAHDLDQTKTSTYSLQMLFIAPPEAPIHWPFVSVVT
jgi:hypothetical protein